MDCSLYINSESLQDMTAMYNILIGDTKHEHYLKIYRQVSNIRRIKFQHLKYSYTVLRLSLLNPLKPDVKSRMKM